MSSNDDLSMKILDLIESTLPESVEALVELVHEKNDIPKDMIIKRIIMLQNEGKITMLNIDEPINFTFAKYLTSSHAYWFWTIILISFITSLSVYFITESQFPYVYIRYIFGSLFVLLLPGYSLIKTLFPTKEIDDIERTVLSIGMSLALVPIVGLLLNFTSYGIRLTPIVVSLLILTIFFAITGVMREHQKKLS